MKWLIFMKGATAYEFQIGRFGGGYCYLYGGHWKHPFQPSRFHFFWTNKDGDIIYEV